MSFVELNNPIQQKMRSIREYGELSPVTFGFRTWNNYEKKQLIQGSRKCTMLLGGEPNHGKSAFCNELVIQMIEKHRFKVALFTTESGDVEKVFAYFCGLYIGKPYSKVRPDGKPNQYAMSDNEATEAEYFIRQHLYVFRQDRKNTKYQTLENIYKELKHTEDTYGFKFDSMVIDPIYDVDDFEPKAEEVLRVLNRINLEAEENNRFDIIVNHVAETAKVTDKNGNRKKLTALADEFYGGKNNNRKAMLQILVHRPSACNGEDGKPVVLENQTNIKILKVKPEGIAIYGTYPIYWDWKKRRYYEMYDENGKFFKQYSNSARFQNKIQESQININNHKATPNEAFATEHQDDDLQF